MKDNTLPLQDLSDNKLNSKIFALIFGNLHKFLAFLHFTKVGVLFLLLGPETSSIA